MFSTFLCCNCNVHSYFIAKGDILNKNSFWERLGFSVEDIMELNIFLLFLGELSTGDRLPSSTGDSPSDDEIIEVTCLSPLLQVLREEKGL